MRKSVEHFGPQHELHDIFITDGLVFRVCPDFEFRRFQFMSGILAAHAVAFKRQPFPVQYPTASRTGRCYDQAFDLAINCNLPYCEGVLFAFMDRGAVFPMPHAWCCTDDGKVVDPTCANIQHDMHLLHVGIPMHSHYVLDFAKKYGYVGLLDGHPELGDSVGVYQDHPSLWQKVIPGLTNYLTNPKNVI